MTCNKHVWSVCVLKLNSPGRPTHKDPLDAQLLPFTLTTWNQTTQDYHQVLTQVKRSHVDDFFCHQVASKFHSYVWWGSQRCNIIFFLGSKRHDFPHLSRRFSNPSELSSSSFSMCYPTLVLELLADPKPSSSLHLLSAECFQNIIGQSVVSNQVVCIADWVAGCNYVYDNNGAHCEWLQQTWCSDCRVFHHPLLCSSSAGEEYRHDDS